MRRNVMHPQYQPKDLPEKWIHQFAKQNMEAGALWSNSYNQIEKAMWDLRIESHDPAIGREKAMTKFMDWLTSPEVTKGTDIPFPDEANAFANVYWRNKGLYKQEVEKENDIKPAGNGGASPAPSSLPRPPSPSGM